MKLRARRSASASGRPDGIQAIVGHAAVAPPLFGVDDFLADPVKGSVDRDAFACRPPAADGCLMGEANGRLRLAAIERALTRDENAARFERAHQPHHRFACHDLTLQRGRGNQASVGAAHERAHQPRQGGLRLASS